MCVCVSWTSHPSILRRIFFFDRIHLTGVCQQWRDKVQLSNMMKKMLFGSLSQLLSLSFSFSLAPSSSLECMPADMEQIALWTNRSFLPSLEINRERKRRWKLTFFIIEKKKQHPFVQPDLIYFHGVVSYIFFVHHYISRECIAVGCYNDIFSTHTCTCKTHSITIFKSHLSTFYINRSAFDILSFFFNFIQLETHVVLSSSLYLRAIML